MKRIPAAFYENASGQEPVRQWLKALNEKDRKIIGDDIRLVEFGWPVGMPVCRPLGNRLWEVRSNLTQGRISRVLFCVRHERIVLPHAFIKKTQKTPDADMALALQRKKDIA